MRFLTILSLLFLPTCSSPIGPEEQLSLMDLQREDTWECWVCIKDIT